MLLIYDVFLNLFNYFQKYSLGGPTITPFQFAEILLRHTNFDLQDINERLSSNDPELPSEVSLCLFICLSCLLSLSLLLYCTS